MTHLAIATLLTLALPAMTAPSQTAPDTRPGVAMPALGGITPPAGSLLLNMDLVARPKPRGDPAVYEIRSPLDVYAFRSRYAEQATRAGYKVSNREGHVVGSRADGTAFRLNLWPAATGSAGLLTITPAQDDPV